MSLTYLLIPLFFIALILYVSWPLLTEGETANQPKAASRRTKHS